ncbi:helix-turn-helix domain-containing protein [Paenibacillus aceris]|uniref:AraC-like DNA-binding protein n=1 Tax=Paenibacillus aceris TaxID=869555 RepID=A0ABS4I2J9_9BACL|nr:helix-turn-helix domain-containing protein [Paenibacillus aceris]MBP1964970.1 AraC-like DNA-binding protein [Paenibacillus aceris]NHW35631.1 helix-turn-helix domain-containing protein [Paenibacillus aceris]
MIFTNPNQPDLAYVCKMLYESIQLPIFYNVDEHSPIEAIWGTGFQYSPFISEPEALVRPLIEQEMEYPVIRTTNFWEQFIVLPVKRNGKRHACIVIGPSIQQMPNDEQIVNQMNDFQIPYRDLPRWKAYLSSLPAVNQLRLLHIGVLAHSLVNQEALEITDVLQYGYQYALPSTFKNNVELTISTQREFSMFHQSMEAEKQFFNLIRNGDKKELMKQVINFSYSEAGVLAKRSQIRNNKNLAICGVAIAMRAALDGGLFEETAYTLSDLYIQQIEELHDARAVEAVMVNALMDFTERVAQGRNSRGSKPIRECRKYIYEHLYEDITVDKLSKLTGLNGNYLMQLFKKQTGLTLMNYIQQERVEEAKKLLNMTNDTVSSIASRLSFYDQAHFIKVFRKHTGVTPKQYRSN